MHNFFKIQRRLVPDLTKIVEKRFNILKEIQNSEPIGRRQLAERLQEGERAIRNELEFLSEAGLVSVNSSGASLTPEGHGLLNELVDYIKAVKDISELEESVRQVLGIKKVIIVPDSSDSTLSKKELGRFAARELRKIIASRLTEGPVIVAVTGGTTMEEIAKSMGGARLQGQLIVIPGRGGLSERMEIQANTIAATFADKLGGTYVMLHVPDNLQESTLQSIMREQEVREVLDLLAKANILIHGVGTAREMAERRRMRSEEIARLEEVGAVGEAFGFYFNRAGEPVYSTTSIGLRLDDLAKKNMEVIAIAEGENKAQAILSVVTPQYHDMLITDELTANEILKIRNANCDSANS